MESKGRIMTKETRPKFHRNDGIPSGIFAEKVETSSAEFIPVFESSSSDSSEFEENAASGKGRQIQKVDVCNANDDTNPIPSIITKRKRLVWYSDTSDDASSDYLRSPTPIDNGFVQVPVGTYLVPGAHNGKATSTDQTTTKRKRAPQSWKKNKSALLREKGEGYKSYSGKDIPKKTPNLGMLCNEACPYKCSVKFSEEQRKSIFADFYKLNVNAKNALLYNCISKVNVVRQRKDANKHKSSSFLYMVKNECETIRVCKTALAAIFNIGRGKIDHIQKFITAGHSIPPPDCRGKHTNRPHRIASEVVDYIENHIRSFPCHESHYSQTTNIHKKYLSPLLSLKKMHDLYLDEVSTNDKPGQFKVTESTYRHIFSSKFNLSFGHPRSQDVPEGKFSSDNFKHFNDNFRREFL